jgi:NAD(P)H-dependent FMN reductase
MKQVLADSGRIETEILDLQHYNLPMLEERFRVPEDAPAGTKELQSKIEGADALVIVTPEYNHGYPAVIKNMFDHFLPEFRRKPIGIVTVSAGNIGGIDCLGQLRHVVLWMGAVPLPIAFPVTKVQESFGDDGIPNDPAYQKRADRFLDELLWFTEALTNQKEKDEAGVERA